jgi:hypothetical protein
MRHNPPTAPAAAPTVTAPAASIIAIAASTASTIDHELKVSSRMIWIFQ